MAIKPMTEAPLVVRRTDEGHYSVSLAGLDLTSLLSADGLSIVMEFSEWVARSEPVVTMTFAPGALDVDLDAPLLAYLRERDAAERAEAEE